MKNWKIWLPFLLIGLVVGMVAAYMYADDVTVSKTGKKISELKKLDDLKKASGTTNPVPPMVGTESGK